MAKMTGECSGSRAGRLSIAVAALTGSATASMFYLMCWLIAVMAGGTMGHLVLELFTSFETSPILALLEGVVWSWVVGSLAGSILAIIYNGLLALERR